MQMGADATARTKRTQYGGEQLSAATCTNLIAKLMHEQCGRCASCDHEVVLAAGAGIFMASLDKVGDRYDYSAPRCSGASAASASSTTSTPPLATR